MVRVVDYIFEYERAAIFNMIQLVRTGLMFFFPPRSHVLMLSIFVFRVIVSESVGDGMHVAIWWQRSAKLHELQSLKR